MTVFTDTWNGAFEALPADTNDVSAGASRMRQTRVAVSERLVVDHSWAGDAADGEHTKVTLPTGSAPTAVADKGILYAKDVSSKAELHYIDEDSNEIQLTDGGSVSSALPIGAVISYPSATPPTNWLVLNGETIGSAASGADNAAANYETLFTLFWNNTANTECAVSGGRGASAAADFAANKTLTMPDGGGRALFGYEASASRLTSAACSIDSTAIADSGGDQLIPNHTHQVTAGSSVNDVDQDNSNSPEHFMRVPAALTSTNPIAPAAQIGGSSANVPPALIMVWIIKAV